MKLVGFFLQARYAVEIEAFHQQQEQAQEQPRKKARQEGQPGRPKGRVNFLLVKPYIKIIGNLNYTKSEIVVFLFQRMDLYKSMLLLILCRAFLYYLDDFKEERRVSML